MISLCGRDCCRCVMHGKICAGCSLCEAAICTKNCGKCYAMCFSRPMTAAYINHIGGPEIELQPNIGIDIPIHIPVLPDRFKKIPPYKLLPVIGIHGENAFSRNGEKVRKIYEERGFCGALNVDERTQGILEFYIKDRTLEGFWEKRKSIYPAMGELAQMAINRLNAIRTVVVPVYSQTRGWTEDTPVTFDPDSPGEAIVQSASGTQHQVNYNDDTCTCQDYRIRGRRCRHINATHQALGEIEREYATPESSSGRITTPVDVEHATNEQRDIDTQAEAERREIQNIEEDDGFFYSDNEQAFNDYMARASREELSYDYENALNGNKITFGLEIEFVGGNPDAIARELYNEGICGYDHQVRYHAPSVPGKWKLERDGSVSDGSGGGELVSPVLRDTPETWRNLEKICEVAKRHGAQIDYKCGGHVHMAMDPLDTARQRWKRFFRTIGGFEDVIYRIAGGTEGRIRRGYRSYATPFRARSAEAARNRMTMNDISDVNRIASQVSNNDRYYGINLTNIPQSGKPNTVEFRYFNSSLDHRQLQANVKLAAGIMMASEKARTQDHHESGLISSEAMKRRGNILKEHPLGTNSHSDDSAVKKLVDIVFTRKKDKDAILAVYAKNQWAD